MISLARSAPPIQSIMGATESFLSKINALTESLLTFIVLTIAFTLFSSMVALKTAYDHAINVNRMDRLLVTARFCCRGLSIARRDEITRIPGVRGAMAVQWVFGFHQEPSMDVGISMIDQAGIAESVRERIPEFAVLKTIGFGGRQIAALVLLEAALPCIAGAVLGTVFAGALSPFTSRLADGSELNLPPSSVSIWIVALALGVALLIGAASAVLPLRRLRALELASSVQSIMGAAAILRSKALF